MFLLFFGKMFRGPPNKPLMSKSTFFTIVGSLIAAAILLGFVLPWLVSAKSTFAVIGAVLLITGIIATISYFILVQKGNSK